MPYIRNPYGRIVSVNDSELDRWLAEPGFTRLDKQEETEYIKERLLIIAKNNLDEMTAKGIYFSTVSQSGRDGYAIASNCMMRELRNLGIPCSTTYTGQKIAILFHNPYSILRIEAPYRIIYTMFESDKIPDDWTNYLEAADMVIVPSKWCRDVFAKAGIKADVIPLGYDQKIFTYKERTAKTDKKRPFVFLHYNAFNIRKGFTEVFKAFVAEFDKAEPVKMVFKTTLEQLPLPITKAEYPNIEIIRGKTHMKEIWDLLCQADCFVYPSRGEGFGMPPLEAMATGIPAIVPNAHGISEYFDEKYMYEVAVDSTCPALYSRYKNQDVGNMVVCDIDDLRKKMRWAYTHPDACVTMGKKAAEYAEKWTYAETGKKLKAVLDEIMLKGIKERTIRNILTFEQV